MNYFAHGRHFVDDAYFLAGTAVPDWLNVVDRRARIRSKQAERHCDTSGSAESRVAAGIVQHHRDDAWFHSTRAFAELSLAICHQLRTELAGDAGFRPHFLGHILVEILLDAALVADDPGRLAAYYAAIDSLDTGSVEYAVNTIVGRPVPNLATFIGLFSRERFLSDYTDDAKLLVRLNQVMQRVGLPLLPSRFADSLAEPRRLVAERKFELLAA